jgi:hypothetical protein
MAAVRQFDAALQALRLQRFMGQETSALDQLHSHFAV